MMCERTPSHAGPVRRGIGEHREQGHAGHAIGGTDFEGALLLLHNKVGARVAPLAEGVPPGRAPPRRPAEFRLFEQRLCVIRRVSFCGTRSSVERAVVASSSIISSMPASSAAGQPARRIASFRASVSHSASMVGASFVGAARRRCSRAPQASPFVNQLID